MSLPSLFPFLTDLDMSHRGYPKTCLRFSDHISKVLPLEFLNTKEALFIFINRNHEFFIIFKEYQNWTHKLFSCYEDVFKLPTIISHVLKWISSISLSRSFHTLSWNFSSQVLLSTRMLLSWMLKSFSVLYHLTTNYIIILICPKQN